MRAMSTFRHEADFKDLSLQAAQINYKAGAFDGLKKVSGGQRGMTVLREVGQSLDSDPCRQ